MFHTVAPVTGNWENIVSMVRALVAAGLCRVSHIAHDQYENVQIVLGDDSEVRAYYARMVVERDQMRETATQMAAAGDRAAANSLWNEASELLVRYQERSHTVNERPYSLMTNIYGWAMGSLFLSNLGGGKFAITDRGATLEECVRIGCDMAKTKGTTLTMSAVELNDDIEKVSDLVRMAGGSEEAIAWVREAPARKIAQDERNEAISAKCAADRVVRDAAIAAGVKLLDTVRVPFDADRACRVTTNGNGITLRGKAHNPSLHCVVTGGGFSIVRTDFNGVRQRSTVVAAGHTAPTAEEVTHALQGAWAAMAATA